MGLSIIENLLSLLKLPITTLVVADNRNQSTVAVNELMRLLLIIPVVIVTLWVIAHIGKFLLLNILAANTFFMGISISSSPGSIELAWQKEGQFTSIPKVVFNSDFKRYPFDRIKKPTLRETLIGRLDFEGSTTPEEYFILKVPFWTIFVISIVPVFLYLRNKRKTGEQPSE